MQSDERELDDPVLRDALRRAAGSETAPPRLRSRVRALLAEGDGQAGAAARSGTSRRALADWWARWQSPIYASAAALVVVFVITLLVLEYNGALDNFTRPDIPVAHVAELPKAFGGSLVMAHNRCAGMTDHHLAAQSAGNDLGAVQLALSEKLQFPIITTSPGEDWTFSGAGACDVNGHASAHLLFSKGARRVSVFSFRADVLKADEGAHYSGTFNGVPVAGFVYASGLHFVVASGGEAGAGGAPSLEEVAAMRDRMAATCGASGCAGEIVPPEMNPAGQSASLSD